MISILTSDLLSVNAQAPKTRIFITDAQTCVRELLDMALMLEGNFQVAGLMGTAAESLEKCQIDPPHIIIAEARMPDMSGSDFVRTVRERWPETRVLIFTGSKNRDAVLEVLEARPHGFVHKDEPLAAFYEVLRAVAKGSHYYSGYAVKLLDAEQSNGRMVRLTLSARERTVLTLLARGLSSKLIGVELQISAKTVDYYRASLMTKLNIHDVAGLTRYAVSIGLVHLEH